MAMLTISIIGTEFIVVYTPLYWSFFSYTASAEIQHSMHRKRRSVIISAEFSGKQSHEIGPWSADSMPCLGYLQEGLEHIL